MKINKNEFCGLSSSEPFLNWLHRINVPLYQDLTDHTAKSLGCKSNREKMEQIFVALMANEQMAKALEDFIQATYPYIIIPDKVTSPNSLNKHGVFAYYDPVLNTIPRRLIITAAGARGKSIQEHIKMFCADKGFCDSLVLDDTGYIEYLTIEQLRLKDSIPEKNWMIKKFRKKHNL